MPSAYRAVVPIVAEKDVDIHINRLRHQYRNVRDGQCDIRRKESVVQALLCRWNRCGELFARYADTRDRNHLLTDSGSKGNCNFIGKMAGKLFEEGSEILSRDKLKWKLKF